MTNAVLGLFGRVKAALPARGETIGLIAGSGDFPILIAESAHAQGYRLCIAAVERPDATALRLLAHAFGEHGLGDGERVIAQLKENGVRNVMMAGGVPKRKVFDAGFRPDALTGRVLGGLKGGRGDDAILRAVAAVIAMNGMRVMSPAAFLADRITPKGVLTRRAPDERESKDMRQGFRAAKHIGKLDIGQTVVVKGGSVVAVEAIEGTDAAIRRAGELGIVGGVVVKVSKPRQDLRFDMPVAGLATVETARRAGCTAIALEAGKTLLIDREAAVRAADEHGLAIAGI